MSENNKPITKASNNNDPGGDGHQCPQDSSKQKQSEKEMALAFYAAFETVIAQHYPQGIRVKKEDKVLHNEDEGQGDLNQCDFLESYDEGESSSSMGYDDEESQGEMEKDGNWRSAVKRVEELYGIKDESEEEGDKSNDATLEPSSKVEQKLNDELGESVKGQEDEVKLETENDALEVLEKDITSEVLRDAYENEIVEDAGSRLGLNSNPALLFHTTEMIVTSENVINDVIGTAIKILGDLENNVIEGSEAEDKGGPVTENNEASTDQSPCQIECGENATEEKLPILPLEEPSKDEDETDTSLSCCEMINSETKDYSFPPVEFKTQGDGSSGEYYIEMSSEDEQLEDTQAKASLVEFSEVCEVLAESPEEEETEVCCTLEESKLQDESEEKIEGSWPQEFVESLCTEALLEPVEEINRENFPLQFFKNKKSIERFQFDDFLASLPDPPTDEPESKEEGIGEGDNEQTFTVQKDGEASPEKQSLRSSAGSSELEEDNSGADITCCLSATITAITDYESDSLGGNLSKEDTIEDEKDKKYVDVEVVGVSRTSVPNCDGELVRLLSKIQVCLENSKEKVTSSDSSDSESETEQAFLNSLPKHEMILGESNFEFDPDSVPPLDPTRFTLHPQSWTDMNDMIQDDNVSNYWDGEVVASRYNADISMNKKLDKIQKNQRKSYLQNIGAFLTAPFRVIYNFFRKK